MLLELGLRPVQNIVESGGHSFLRTVNDIVSHYACRVGASRSI